ncbi:hypothetical protein ACTMU2_21325 [Cupriavidus basilensis]
MYLFFICLASDVSPKDLDGAEENRPVGWQMVSTNDGSEDSIMAEAHAMRALQRATLLGALSKGA